MDRRETVTLKGDLGAEDQRRFYQAQLERIWESGVENLDIDMSGVNRVDFNSLTELLKERNRFLQAGTSVELRNIPDHVMRILEIFRVPYSRNS